MVLGLRSKNRKGTIVHVDYIIHIQEIKPWPPSQSLKSLRSVVLSWENGDRNSGSTNAVAPSLGSTPAEGKIEFKESFKLKVNFLKEGSPKGNDSGAFQKNVLELNLYEPRRDKTKGQHLGSATVDLAELGILQEAVCVSAPVSCKRSFRNNSQPVLHLRIQQFDRDGSTSSRESLQKEVLMDKDGKESVSVLMNEEYAEEAEIASFTDDDDDESSHSSLANSSPTIDMNADLPGQSSNGIKEYLEESRQDCNEETSIQLESEPAKEEIIPATVDSHLSGDIIDQNGCEPQQMLVEEPNNPEVLGNYDASLPLSTVRSSAVILEKSEVLDMNLSSSSVIAENLEEEIVLANMKENLETNYLVQEVQEKKVEDGRKEDVVANSVEEENITKANNMVGSLDNDQIEKQNILNNAEPESNVENDEGHQDNINMSVKLESGHGSDSINLKKDLKEKQMINELDVKRKNHSIEKDGRAQENGNGLAEINHASDFMNLEKHEKQIVHGSEVKSENHSIEVQQTSDYPDSLSAVSDGNVDQGPVFEQKNSLQSYSKMTFQSDLSSSTPRFPGVRSYNSLSSDRAKNIKFSVRSPSDFKRSITRRSSVQSMEDVEIDFQGDVHSRRMSETEEVMDDQESTSSGADNSSTINSNGFYSNKVQELELRVELLEGELRETAAVEIGLYSITSEHCSSSHKVHTPARRLSRLYLHCLKHWSKERTASVARSASSGLVLVAKACGNDVPRLTFWLSNSVVLRAIVSQATKLSEITGSNGPYSAEEDLGRMSKRKSSTLRWESIYRKKGRKGKLAFTEELELWEDPDTFISALEKIENWIFSRVVESIWWQTVTPHMQSTTGSNEPKIRSHMNKSFNGRALPVPDQQHENFSMEIWKRAFKDASERLCPLRAGRHQCGCLPILPRLVMEQCVSRLDVAMFNAILRESDDEIPTDPISDPISDPYVLPIPSGKLSFGAGAQLKNAIGNWSRWLTDLLGMDEDEPPQIENEQDDDRLDVAASLKYFHLLNAFSDLLMLPKDMLLERSIRKEVCPTFSPSIIKRILDSFLPDEFCPDLVPEDVLEALESEGHLENSEDGIRNVPCCASPVVYSPPPVDSVLSIIENVATPNLRRSGSSLIRKSYTSDDELEGLDSPLASIVDISSTPTAKSKQKNTSHAVRYQLLQEVWRGDN